MANLEHIKWLVEGVTAWNARRKIDAFIPDFEQANIHTAFAQAGRLDQFLKSGLKGANLEDADFGGVNLEETNLAGAILRGANLRKANLRQSHLAGADLRGANFGEADLTGAEFDGAYLGVADLSGAILKGAFFSGAYLEGAVLEGADLREADLEGANLDGSFLGKADLRGAFLSGAVLDGADLEAAFVEGADVRTIAFSLSAISDGDVVFTDLSRCTNLVQAQVDLMLGDTGVRLHKGLKRADHWPDWRDKFALKTGTSIIGNAIIEESTKKPTLPNSPTKGDQVFETNGKITLIAEGGPPNRNDLAILFQDLKTEIEQFRASGDLDNISRAFVGALGRFLEIIPDDYADLQQVRFGVATTATRMRYATSKSDIERSAPEKTGFIEAILYTADLLCARLPDWIAFLKEEEDDREIVADKTDAFDTVLNDAATALEKDPNHFDPSLAARIREYIDTKTIEGYLAAKALLANIAYTVFTATKDFTKDTISATRKNAVGTLAAVFVAETGAVLLNLANLLPAELNWMVTWLDYLAKTLI